MLSYIRAEYQDSVEKYGIPGDTVAALRAHKFISSSFKRLKMDSTSSKWLLNLNKDHSPTK